MRSIRKMVIPREVGALAAALLAATIVFAPAAASPMESPGNTGGYQVIASADACLDAEEVAFLANINEHRQLSGLAPLSVSASLSSAAAYHSIDMALNGYLDHNLLDGTSVPQNMANFGYSGGTYGENIAAGMESADAAMQTWQGSYEHNANMLNGQFGTIGIGRAYDETSAHGWYWTTIFGDVSDGPGWLCGETPPPGDSVSLFQSVDGATSESDVNLRTGPGEVYDLVATLPPATEMTVTGNEQQSYLPVKVNGMYGWVSAEWVQRGSVALEQTAEPAQQPGTATALDSVPLLSAPVEQGGVLGTIPAISVVSLTGVAQDGYLEVDFGGQVGWADAAYLEIANAAPGATLLQPAASSSPDQPAMAAPENAAGVSPAIGAEAFTTTNVNLRAQPSPDAMVVRVVPAGTQVSLTGSQVDGYVNVRINGQAGWLDSDYLQ